MTMFKQRDKTSRPNCKNIKSAAVSEKNGKTDVIYCKNSYKSFLFLCNMTLWSLRLWNCVLEYRLEQQWTGSKATSKTLVHWGLPALAARGPPTLLCDWVSWPAGGERLHAEMRHPSRQPANCQMKGHSRSVEEPQNCPADSQNFELNEMIIV